MARCFSQLASRTTIISKWHGKFERCVLSLVQISGITKYYYFSKERVMIIQPSTEPTCSNSIYYILELVLRHVLDTAVLFLTQLWIFIKESGAYHFQETFV